MRTRVIDLDGSISAQDRVLRLFRPDVYDMRQWGPRLRLGCRWNRFYRFERRLDRLFGSREHLDPWISLLGSGDFHHLTLALLRRVQHPFNLLVLDKHPDWMSGFPILHCGTWLHHAAKLSNVRRIFHLGGETDFDNAFRCLAPKKLLRSGKIVTLPAIRSFDKGFWRDLPTKPLRANFDSPVNHERLEELLWPYVEELDRLPLYISLDKDVMWMPESVANWDSGYLDLNEVQDILQFFLKAAGNELIGMDIVGDWSAVQTSGLMRHLMHRVEHPRQRIDAEQARLCNERTNSMLLRFLQHDPIAESITFPSRLKSA
jgi:arginase family enzyme